ncbi:hypothetical protein OCGS_0827 [Oceaniovalibus guishaninsula JLT2003]|uniref:FAD-binding domain-containing protein n=1 Tax=Oceaniovalibus guishaninsula JLT2003 TaxID=1231392 RepID=K2HF95_9RHOB|nr:FAD-dependent oxidoreductase [Oceaniovalibus guishaninsula]EKE45132.1 hypothetical protein OCGS_0827 [Oceaniovalibus guishaninsula JLT2003]
MRVAVLGGGIGGLAAALAFARRGHDVAVFERAPDLTEVGAGLQISPNGMAVLRALGVGDAIATAGLRSAAVVLRDGPSGRLVLRMDLAGRDFLLMHRADLIGVLADAARAAGVALRLGRAVRAVGTDGRVDGEAFDLVAAADGLHSVARGVLNGPAHPFFTGQVAWRATVPGDAAREAVVRMGPGRHLVAYPLRGGTVNLVGVEERRDWTAEGWHHAGDPDAFRAAFAGFGEARDLLGRVDGVNLWGLFRHEVAQIWQAGRLALLGDAAHPTLPFLAQGANLALEDAWVLAAQADDLPRYQALRRPRAVRAIAAANANARNYHLRGPARLAAHAALRMAPGTLMLRRLDWLYGCDVTRG